MGIISSIAIILCIIVVWLISVALTKGFFNDVMYVKRCLWFWKILAYTPIINTIILFIQLFAAIGIIIIGGIYVAIYKILIEFKIDSTDKV
jgi:hypothetical protein